MIEKKLLEKINGRGIPNNTYMVGGNIFTNIPYRTILSNLKNNLVDLKSKAITFLKPSINKGVDFLYKRKNKIINDVKDFGKEQLSNIASEGKDFALNTYKELKNKTKNKLNEESRKILNNIISDNKTNKNNNKTEVTDPNSTQSLYGEGFSEGYKKLNKKSKDIINKLIYGKGLKRLTY